MQLAATLNGSELSDVQRLEPDWSFEFSNGTVLVASTPWRASAAGTVQATSADHGHVFGCVEPLDAGGRAISALGGRVASVTLAEVTLDLGIAFEDGGLLEFLRMSTGYEAWHLTAPGSGVEMVLSGGELRMLRS